MARSKKPVSPDEEAELEKPALAEPASATEVSDRPEADAPLELTEPISEKSPPSEHPPETSGTAPTEADIEVAEIVEESERTDAQPPIEAERPDAVSPDPAPAPPRPRGSGGGFAGGLVGGALVALAAAGGVYVVNPSVFQAPIVPDVAAAVAPVAARLESDSERVGALAGEVAALREAVEGADPSAISAQLRDVENEMTRGLDRLSADIVSIREALGGLEIRLAAAERKPVGDGSAVVDTSAYESELVELRATVEAQQAAAAQMAADIERLTSQAEERLAALASEAQEMQAEAAAAARTATARAALSLVQAALEGGGPFDRPLEDFAAARGISPPDALLSVAATGVPTLPDLLRTFPDAARAALDASIRARLNDSEGAMDRVFAFLQSQSGARSLEPRDGDDPDAVLSRAEAALREGRLGDVIALLDTLPGPGQAAIASWRGGASQRAAALEAAAGLVAAMATN